MNKLLWLGLMIVLVSALILSGCAQPAPVPAPKPTPAPSTAPAAEPAKTAKPAATPFSITLKSHMYQTSTHSSAEVVRWWCGEISKRTGGSVKFDYFWAEALGKPQDQLDGLKAGIFDMGAFNTSYKPAQVPLWQLNWSPYSLTDDVTVGSKMWDELGDLPIVRQQFAKWDVKHLYWTNTGGARWLWSKKLVKTLDDLKGLKVRAAGETAKVLAAAGASTVSIGGAETYDALQKGTIAAAEGNPMTAQSYAWHEACKYGYTLNLGFGGLSFGMRLSVWDKLPPDIQKVIRDVNNEAPAFNAVQAKKSNDDVWKDFNKVGLTLTECSKQDQDKFRDTYVMPWVQEWIKNMEGQGVPAKEFFDAYATVAKKYAK